MSKALACLLAVVLAAARVQEHAKRAEGPSSGFVAGRYEPAEYFPGRVVGVTDLDLDGTPDLLVSDYGVDMGPGGGAALLSGLDGTVIARFTGGETEELFGYSLGAAPDLDGDGIGELIVGAVGGVRGTVIFRPGSGRSSLEGNRPKGIVRVYSGSSRKLMLELVGEEPLDGFGRSVAPVGDVTGDEVADVLVGANGYGAVFSGSDGARVLRFEGPVNESDSTFDDFGFSICGIGDVNGDGVPDIAIGAPDRAFDRFRRGAVDVFSGHDGSRLYSIQGKGRADQFGTAIAALEDVDHDGVQDFLASSLHQYVRVVSGADGQEVLTVPSLANGDFKDGFGASLAVLDDVDGDGFEEFLVGTYDTAWPVFGDQDLLYSVCVSGGTGRILAKWRGSQFGTRVAALGDFDGDGFKDFALLHPARPGALEIRSGKRFETIREFSPLERIGSLTSEVRLRVLGIDTGEDLSDLELATSHSNLHPGQTRRRIVHGSASPLLLPSWSEWDWGKDTTFTRRWWVRAPGYAWEDIEVDQTRGGMRELVLDRGGDLRVAIDGEYPDAIVRVTLAPANAPDEIIARSIHEGEPRLVEGLRVGDYALGVIEGFHDPTVLLFELDVSIRAGETTEVVLRSEEIEEALSRVRSEGEDR